jgi:hypothetical protein
MGVDFAGDDGRRISLFENEMFETPHVVSYLGGKRMFETPYVVSYLGVD